LKTKDWIEFYL